MAFPTLPREGSLGLPWLAQKLNSETHILVSALYSPWVASLSQVAQRSLGPSQLPSMNLLVRYTQTWLPQRGLKPLSDHCHPLLPPPYPANSTVTLCD